MFAEVSFAVYAFSLVYGISNSHWRMAADYLICSHPFSRESESLLVMVMIFFDDIRL
jgi:hypothetical protein